MDRNTGIGMGLLLVLFFVWVKLNAPTEAQIKLEKLKQDSLKRVELSNVKPSHGLDKGLEKKMALSSNNLDTSSTSNEIAESISTLQNDLIKVDFTNKGGRIKKVLLKNYFKQREDDFGKVIKEPLYLLEDYKNEYFYSIKKQDGSILSTANLVFDPIIEGNLIRFKYQSPEGIILLTYEVQPSSYILKHKIAIEGIKTLDSDAPATLSWTNFLDKLEVNYAYEKNYSSVYYKESDKNPSYCSCTANDEKELNKKPVKWVSHANQFFNSAIIAETGFKSAKVATEMLDENSADLKKMKSEVVLNLEGGASSLEIYSGPNEFDRLKSFGIGLEDVVSYGSSIFGTINRYPIRWIYNFFASFISSKGIIILCMTLFVKLLLIYLTFRMIYSQSKMAALKPEIEKLKAKYGDDQQAMQAQSMKVYSEHGVNPLGGCMPMLLQMPIWIALTRYFSASIEFRQESFLWAKDLTSYDIFMHLPVNIPFYGSHVSMFTLLWTVSTLAYTWYNSRLVDMSNMNPAMKYMQYIMPVMFIFFFNNSAAGFTCYLFFSNLLNIAQTVLIKNFLIDENKINNELQAFKSKPKSTTGFRARLEQAMKDQEKVRNPQSKKK